MLTNCEARESRRVLDFRRERGEKGMLAIRYEIMERNAIFSVSFMKFQKFLLSRNSSRPLEVAGEEIGDSEVASAETQSAMKYPWNYIR